MSQFGYEDRQQGSGGILANRTEDNSCVGNQAPRHVVEQSHAETVTKIEIVPNINKYPGSAEHKGMTANYGCKARAKPWYGERDTIRPTPAGSDFGPDKPHATSHCAPWCTSKAGADAPRGQGQAPSEGVELQLGCQVPGPVGPVTKPPMPKASSVSTPARGRGWSQAAVYAGGVL